MSSIHFENWKDKGETNEWLKSVIFISDLNFRVMDFQATKLELMRLLLNTRKEGVLQQIKDVFAREGELDLDVQNEMIASAKKSNEDIKEGRVYSIDEAENLLEKRLDA